MTPERKANLILWTVTGLVSVAVFCLLFFAIIRNDSLVGWHNALLISGVVVLCSGLLYLMAWAGTFEIFVYGFSDVFFHMNPSPNKTKKYKDYPEYVNAKREERKTKKPYFWPFLAFGGTLIIAAIVVYIVFKAQGGI
jgi:hypothetical protein